MNEILSGVIDNITDFLSGVASIFTDDFMPLITEDQSGVMITFVVAFPLCFLGVWLIKRIIRVKDSD